jgi:hypothetical protein
MTIITSCDTNAVAAEIKRRITIPDLGRKFFPGWKPGPSCRSPFREDRNASFSVSRDGTKFFDHGNVTHKGDVFDFYRLVVGCDKKQAFKDLLALAGGDNVVVTPIVRAPDPLAEKVEVKRQQFHPVLLKLGASELNSISDLRSIAPDALEIAVQRGFLWVSVLKNHLAWVLTDQARNAYLARRLEGEPWEHLDSKPKAWLLPGSRGNWPIGIQESSPYPAIAITEGGPDFLAAFGHAWASGVENQVAPIYMSGASQSIPDDALDFFKGKRVRIFTHDDEVGYRAARRWALQLRGIVNKVHGYRFDGLIQGDGTLVADLNDMLRIDYDCWEQNRAVVESVMSFAR